MSEYRSSQSAEREAMEVFAAFRDRLHDLAKMCAPEDPKRDAYWAAWLAAEDTGWQMQRALAAVQSVGPGVPMSAGLERRRVPGENTCRKIQRYAPNQGWR